MKHLMFFMACILAVGLTNNVNAQDFIPRTLGYSSKKAGSLKTKEGKTIEGYVKSMKYKKGLIKQIKMKDLNGQKYKFKAEQVEWLRVPPSKLGNLAALSENATSIKKMTKSDFGSIVKKDFIYFEKALLPGKKPRYLLLQLVNPGFDSKIKVFDDPRAKKTAGVGVAGIQATGGELRSFYVVKNGTAQKVKKKDYSELQDWIFGDCKALNEAFEGDLNFKQFASHVFFYDQECN